MFGKVLILLTLLLGGFSSVFASTKDENNDKDQRATGFVRSGTVQWPWHRHRQEKKQEFMGATIRVNHVQHSSDTAVVSESLVAAYNQVHGKDKHFHVQAALVQSSAAIPEERAAIMSSLKQDENRVITTAVDEKTAKEDDPNDNNSLWMDMYYWLMVDYWCDACNDQNDLLPPVLATTALHVALEESFCQELRNSGDGAYAEARECGIDFTFSPVGDEELQRQDDAAGAALRKKDPHGKKGKPAHPMGVEFRLAHVDAENPAYASTEESVVNRAFVAAFEAVHGNKFQPTLILERLVDEPEDDPIAVKAVEGKHEPATAGTALGGPSRNHPKWMYRRMWTLMNAWCELCGDDDMFSSPVQSMVHVMMVGGAGKHQALESLFCEGLAKSEEEDAYRQVQHCSIAFSYKSFAATTSSTTMQYSDDAHMLFDPASAVIL